jgi:hypothetical protein
MMTIMKKFYILLAMIIAFGATIQAQNWSDPEPEGTTFSANSGYYVYNVGAKAFLDRGGEWASQAIVFPSKGSMITMIENGSLWTLQYEASNRTLFRANVADGWTYTDNSTENTWNIVLTDAVKNIYSIQSPEAYVSYNAEQFVGASATLFSSNSGVVSDVRYNRPASAYTQWKFCTAASVEKYNAQVKLDKYMKIAKLIGSSVDLTSYIATYNTGSAADINTAAANLYIALAPENKTSTIANANFDVIPTTGWTATANFGYNFQEVEYFGRSFDVNQTITGLPAGVYTLKAQGYERPQALSVAAQDWFNNGWDGRSAKIYATVTGVTTTEPLKSLYSETTSPTGSVINGITYPNSMSNAFDAMTTSGLYDNELTYFVVDATGTAKIGVLGSFRSNGSYTMSQWVLFDNFRLYYYGPLAIPNMTVTKNTIFLSNAVANTTTFDVTGSNLSGDITISAPISGVTLSGNNLINNGGGSYTITNANANATNVITIVWDEVTNVSGNIEISATGVDTRNISLTTSKDKGCFTAHLPNKTNLVPDPYLNSIPGSWGNVSLVSGSDAYCGMYSIKINGTAACWPNGGSISTPAITWTAGNTYHFRAMVKTVDGTFNMGIQNANVNGGSGDYNIEVPNTNGEWTLFTANFTAGTNPTSGVAFFNNCGASTGLVAYIDNWELYDITDLLSGTNNNTVRRLFATAQGNQVTIHGTEAGDQVRIFTLSGQLVKTAQAQAEQLEMNLQSGVYVVKANERVIKVIVQ